MCDKCSQLGSFHAHWSRSLFRDCCLPLLYWFTCNRRCAFPPKPLSHPPLVACPLGHAGIEQLLFCCYISTKTTWGVCGWKEVGIKNTITKNSANGMYSAIRKGRKRNRVTSWKQVALVLYQDLMKLKGVPPVGNSPINTQTLVFKCMQAGLVMMLVMVRKIRYDWVMRAYNVSVISRIIDKITRGPSENCMNQGLFWWF